MPRTHRKRTMKGGFTDYLSNLWNSTKRAASSAYSSVTGTNSSYPSSSYMPSTSYSSSSNYTPSNSYGTSSTTGSYYGGKSRRRRMTGGVNANNLTRSIASNAASVGGRRSHKKSRRARKH
jgi:hypothetical protein